MRDLGLVKKDQTVKCRTGAETYSYFMINFQSLPEPYKTSVPKVLSEALELNNEQLDSKDDDDNTDNTDILVAQLVRYLIIIIIYYFR